VEKIKNLKVIILVGLPASGKTTWAKEYQRKHDNFVCVSRDDFRFMLKNSRVTEPKIESLINKFIKDTVLYSLRAKENVILDGTHLKVNKINEIISFVEYLADIEFMVFDIPAKKCIVYDATRERQKQVGEQVIIAADEHFKILKGSYPFQNIKKKQLHLKPIIIPNFTSPLQSAVIFDIDGTLALLKRGQYEFNKLHRDDENYIISEQIHFHRSKGRAIFIVTGRDESIRKETEEWLEFYDITYDALYMRPAEDFRKDATVKKEIYNERIKDKYNVLCVYDDRLEVVEAWSELGLFVFCVNQGLEIF